MTYVTTLLNKFKLYTDDVNLIVELETNRDDDVMQLYIKKIA